MNAPASARQHDRVRRGYITTLMLTIGVNLFSLGLCSGTTNAAQAESSDTDVGKLLTQLDAQNYQVRETAADQLAGQGIDSLKPMALHSLTSSPESAWRIRSIIEKIGIAGDEDTFYKSTGVLRLLYPLDDAGTTARLEGLRQQWKLTRKKNAIKRLRELGATISDPLGDQTAVAPQALGGGRMVINGRLIVNGQQVLGQQQVNSASTRTDKIANNSSLRKRKSLTDRELIEQVDELLAADLATNRERILGSDDAETAIGQAQGSLLGQNDPFAGNALRTNQFRFGAMALLDDKFRGSPNDLKSLHAINNLTLIHWKDRKLSTSEMAIAHKSSTVTRLHIENCKFPNKPPPESAWPRFATHYEFVNQTIPIYAIERLSGSAITSLKFSKCAASEKLHQELRQIDSLSQLALEDTFVDEQWFESFAKLGSLTRINLTLCKFNSDEYRKLKRIRPNLRIDFTPSAFLGIRSPDLGGANVQRARMLARMRAAQQAKPDQQGNAPELDLPAAGVGCSISEVVANSGAEKAGLKAGDVIVKLGGKPITIFEDIRLIIAQQRAGDKLDVEFAREGQAKKTTIELGSFPKSAIQ